jgi:two-component sensor histidine kinase
MRKEGKNSNKIENDRKQGKTNLIVELHLKEKPFRIKNVTVIMKNLLQLRTRELKTKTDLAENRCVRKTLEYL